jgi:hypothetical protein
MSGQSDDWRDGSVMGFTHSRRCLSRLITSPESAILRAKEVMSLPKAYQVGTEQGLLIPSALFGDGGRVFWSPPDRSGTSPLVRDDPRCYDTGGSCARGPTVGAVWPCFIPRRLGARLRHRPTHRLRLPFFCAPVRLTRRPWCSGSSSCGGASGRKRTTPQAIQAVRPYFGVRYQFQGVLVGRCHR